MVTCGCSLEEVFMDLEVFTRYNGNLEEAFWRTIYQHR